MSIRKLMVILVTIASALSLSACSDTPRPVVTKTVYTASPTPSASETATSNETNSAYSDEEVLANQREKFDYLQSDKRISLFENSGYDVAKVKLAQHMWNGEFGDPNIDQGATHFKATIGDPNDHENLYVWFSTTPNDQEGPDFSATNSIGIRVPGSDYVEIQDTLRPMQTEVDGESADLEYRVLVGSGPDEPTMKTCLFSELDDEKEYCYGSDNEAATKTVTDVVRADMSAIEILDANMQQLFYDDWREG